jgi:hypothetical protein
MQKNIFVGNLIFLQNWNFNREEGRAASNINFWRKTAQDEARRFFGSGSVDCVSCYATFKVDARIRYEIEAGFTWYLFPYLNYKFMAEFSLQAIANIDVQFDFSATYNYEPPARQLAKIRPMLNEALGAFNILGFPLSLSVTFGLDISVGIKFHAKSLLFISAGADVVCNYKFGVYHNYDRDTRNNGCRFNYHPLVARAAGAIEVTIWFRSA